MTVRRQLVLQTIYEGGNATIMVMVALHFRREGDGLTVLGCALMAGTFALRALAALLNIGNDHLSDPKRRMLGLEDPITRRARDERNP